MQKLPAAQSPPAEQAWPSFFLQALPEQAYPLATSQLLSDRQLLAQAPAAQRYPVVQATAVGGTQVPLPLQIPAPILARLSVAQTAAPHDSSPWVWQAEPSAMHSALVPQAASVHPVIQQTLVVPIPSPTQWPAAQSASAEQTWPLAFLQVPAAHEYPDAHPVLAPEHEVAHALPTHA
jgi:hypothetical protein